MPVNPSSSAPAGRADSPSFELGAAPAEQPEITIHDLQGVFALTDEAASDGRVARGQRTRRIVGEALIGLLRESDTEPTARAVAERAGVSLRLVFHHFSDLDDLYHYVAALQLRELWSGLPERTPRLALVKRIERIVSHRAELFEEISPVRRAMVRHMITSPGVRDAVLASDALLLQNLRATFAPELAEMSESSRDEYLDAMDTAVSWEAWERMRRTSGLQVRVAKRVMARMLAALCTEPLGSMRHSDAETVGAFS
jgi:TetR/AcrR family transcriptional regulator, regulator of autoinduction and epiphytic fitness